MLLEHIKGFYHVTTKIFLLVARYTIHLNIKAQFTDLASYNHVVDNIYAQTALIMLKYLLIIASLVAPDPSLTL